jgi:hypothetical protein
MMQEGRTKSSIERILALALAPDPESEHPINVFVSQDLVANAKTLRYGWNGDLSVTVGFLPLLLPRLPPNKPHPAAVRRTSFQG